MELTVQGKQMDIGDALRTHVTEKMTDISGKYFNHTTGTTVTFAKEGHGHQNIRVNISVMVGKNIYINSEAEEGDAYGAFDQAAEKAAKRLRRYKKKLRDHHERTIKTPEAEIIKARNYVLAVQADDAVDSEADDGVPEGDDPAVIAEMTTPIETMSVSDAVMRLDLSGENALLFYNSKNNELNLVYRRKDGNVGWIDPEIAAAGGSKLKAV